MHLEVEIGAGEWQQVWPLLTHLGQDESRWTGSLVLRADGTSRWWYATDSHRLARLRGASDQREYTVSIPARAMGVVPVLAGADGTTALRIHEHPGLDQPTLEIVNELGRVELLTGAAPTIDLDAIILEAESANDRGVRVRGPELRTLVRAAAEAPEPLDPEAAPIPVVVGVEGSEVWFRMNWPHVGPTVYGLNGDGAAEAQVTLANPGYLAEAAALFVDELDLSVPSTDEGSILLRDGHLTVLLRPVRSGLERVRDHVEDVIQETFGPDARYRDADGDYVLKSSGTPIYGRLTGGDPPSFGVFAVLLRGIQRTAELLQELNDLNSNLTFVRVVWSDDMVLALAELVAGTMDPEELFTTFRRIDATGSEIGPMIATMFGGTSTNRDQERWQEYLDTVITAEVVPGRAQALNGPEGVQQWPFPGPVHVVTAWNPYNLPRDPEVNRLANVDLALEIVRRNCRFVPARGQARGTDYGEDGFVVWGMSSEEVVEVAAGFGQEAVFELDAEELRLVHCLTGAVTASPRLT